MSRSTTARRDRRTPSPHRERTPTVRRSLRSWLGVALSAILVAGGIVAAPPTASAAPFTVLVFSKTAGFRHGSITPGIAAIQQLGAANGFTVEATEDAAQFTDANLDRFAAVIWLSTTGDVLNAAQQAAFERYITGGGGYVGVHSASDTEYDWPWYGGAGRGVLRLAPGRADRHREGGRPGAPVHRDAAAAVEPVRRVVQLPHQPSGQRARAGHPGRDHLHGWRAWAPTTRSPGARTTPAVEPGTPAWGTPTRRTPRRTSASTCSAASGRPPARSTPTVAPLSPAASSRWSWPRARPRPVSR